MGLIMQPPKALEEVLKRYAKIAAIKKAKQKEYEAEQKEHEKRRVKNCTKCTNGQVLSFTKSKQEVQPDKNTKTKKSFFGLWRK
jgi:hypothetical protein